MTLPIRYHDSCHFFVMDHSFSSCAKCPKKLTFLNPWYFTRLWANQGVRNVSFLENFACLLSELPITKQALLQLKKWPLTHTKRENCKSSEYEKHWWITGYYLLHFLSICQYYFVMCLLKFPTKYKWNWNADYIFTT